VQLLFVQGARGVTFADGTLVLQGVSPTTLFFSDRPRRIAGHVLTRRFLADWGKGEHSFADDPPNATLSVFGDGVVRDVVVELSRPRLRGDDLVYDARLLEGTAPEKGGPSSLFIDAIAAPLGAPVEVPAVGRPYSWDAYVSNPDDATYNPPGAYGNLTDPDPYADLTNPRYFGSSPYAEGPPRAYTLE
jgi:hypothetical protein